jgi:hypothetical protein
MEKRVVGIFGFILIILSLAGTVSATDNSGGCSLRASLVNQDP